MKEGLDKARLGCLLERPPPPAQVFPACFDVHTDWIARHSSLRVKIKLLDLEALTEEADEARNCGGFRWKHSLSKWMNEETPSKAQYSRRFHVNFSNQEAGEAAVIFLSTDVQLDTERKDVKPTSCSCAAKDCLAPGVSKQTGNGPDGASVGPATSR
ncbi:hypothetical protein MG293_012212 [Ovis ammon polii]|uniref:Uncharacterized protein n=1 Tax=Ovis ammon polii TaxID=230172 RepID=A0AAD4U3X6_OVIAM|nr:hypothetical protein MG293_012212 [Ovis ammon polii]